MTMAFLGPGEYLDVRCAAPSNRMVAAFIDSDEPVASYILSPEEMERFRDDADEVDSRGGFSYQRIHNINAQVDAAPYWYLVIMNVGPTRTRLFYEVIPPA